MPPSPWQKLPAHHRKGFADVGFSVEELGFLEELWRADLGRRQSVDYLTTLLVYADWSEEHNCREWPLLRLLGSGVLHCSPTYFWRGAVPRGIKRKDRGRERNCDLPEPILLNLAGRGVDGSWHLRRGAKRNGVRYYQHYSSPFVADMALLITYHYMIGEERGSPDTLLFSAEAWAKELLKGVS